MTEGDNEARARERAHWVDSFGPITNQTGAKTAESTRKQRVIRTKVATTHAAATADAMERSQDLVEKLIEDSIKNGSQS